MVKYGELVDYIKRNHVNWNTDLFDVLKGFFEEYLHTPIPSNPPFQMDTALISSATTLNFDAPKKEFKHPEDGEYTSEDLLDLLSR